MNNGQDPLHGVTLEHIVTILEAQYGWAALGEKINIRCFTDNPSVKSSLKFLRRTPWARAKVEALYVRSVRQTQPKNLLKKSANPPTVNKTSTSSQVAPASAEPRVIPDKWKSF